MKKQTSQRGKKWLHYEMRPFRMHVFFLSVLTFLVSALALAFAYLVRYLINAATNKEPQTVWVFAVILTGLLLTRILVQTINNYSAERLRSKIVCGIRLRVFSGILRSDYASLQKYHSGDLLTRLTADVDEVSRDTVGLCPSIVGFSVQCVGAIAALMTIDFLFTCIYVVSGVVLFLFSVLLKKHVKKYHKEYLQSDGASRAYLQEGAANVTTVKAYNAEEASTQKAGMFVDVYHRKRMQRNRLNAITGVVFSLLNNTGMIFALIWCSISVLNGYTDYGSILSIILLLMQLRQPFSAFSSLLPIYYAAVASGERLSEIDDLPKENIEKTDATSLYADTQEFVFENICFEYEREKVFDGASASFTKGETVCITGASGAGKSTLFRLLLRVFAPKDGKIYARCNGRQVPIDERTRGLFAYVPQGNFLFSGSIRENLTFFAADDVTDEDVRYALKTAEASFVYDLPDGLNTPLLERGGGLSEGQRQRLAIARAILSKRPVLLLDEATSALDEATEKAVLENIKNLNDITCLIVTHRPAALQIADVILKVENSKIKRLDNIWKNI